MVDDEDEDEVAMPVMKGDTLAQARTSAVRLAGDEPSRSALGYPVQQAPAA